ncbi:signal peptide containing protein [Theileria equi strain WA]|uniref:Signal peptide containing protein n=1 Tax=Theileria equi strain WA TaxID=1537102 RepID=L1LEP3_THEEQ|nr:signal peptide containing protein [Theileria equi strain WA]EKX73648.1 signal peptide containing protein [Theileria equi strain WA]|eukprot:XP_004833100.1 signal peptide containing protein [Theileria equi strain WA]
MKVFAILYLFLLVELCHGGDGKKGDQKPEDLDNDPSDRPRGSYTRPSTNMTGGNDATLDLASPTVSIGKSFEYDYDHVQTRMVLPGDSFKLTKIVNGAEEVWNGGTDGRCTQVIISMKDGSPALVYLHKKDSSNRSSLTLLKNGSTWKVTDDYKGELKKLRRTPESVTDFTIKLEDKKDTDQCTVFGAMIYGLSVQFYFPKFGFHATEITHGEKSLWKGDNERALVIKLYKTGNSSLLLLSLRNAEDKCNLKRFESVGTEWNSIEKDAFHKKLHDARKAKKSAAQQAGKPNAPPAKHGSSYGTESSLSSGGGSGIDGSAKPEGNEASAQPRNS